MITKTASFPRPRCPLGCQQWNAPIPGVSPISRSEYIRRLRHGGDDGGTTARIPDGGEEDRRRGPHKGRPQFVDYMLLMGGCMPSLYQNEPARGFDHIEAQHPAYARSMLIRGSRRPRPGSSAGVGCAPSLHCVRVRRGRGHGKRGPQLPHLRVGMTDLCCPAAERKRIRLPHAVRSTTTWGSRSLLEFRFPMAARVIGASPLRRNALCR